MRFPGIEEMEAALSPTDYEELLWSLEYDPPLADLMQITNQLLADFLAVYYTVHRDSKNHPAPFTREDFLPDPEAVDDEADEDAVAEDAPAPVPLHPIAAAGFSGATTGVRLTRGHGAVVPAALFEALKKNAGEG